MQGISNEVKDGNKKKSHTIDVEYSFYVDNGSHLHVREIIFIFYAYLLC